MVTAVLSVIAKNWRQPKCPSAGKWINTLRCTRTTEYYLAIKSGETDTQNRENEGNHTKKSLYDSIYIKVVCKLIIVTEANQWFPGDWHKETWGWLCSLISL